MKKLDRYIFREFLSPLLLIVVGFATLVLLVQVVDSLPSFRDWHAPYHLILAYHLCKYPYLIVQVLPVAMMLSSLVALGGLARGSELAAMRSGGLSPARIALPIIVFSLLVSVVHFAVAEYVVPFFTNEARYIQKVKIERRTLDWDSPWREKMAKSVSGGRQFYIDRFDASQGEMGGVVILKREEGRLLSRLDAVKGLYEKGKWVFYDGVERTFDEQGLESAVRPFKSWSLALKEKPADFVVENNQREDDLLQLSISQLSRIIAILKITGSDFRKELACLHIRISYPLSCFILALLGCSLPFLFPYGQRALVGTAVGIVTSLACGMLYLVFIQVGLSLGKSGVLPIPLAAWMANFTFAALGAWALRRASK